MKLEQLIGRYLRLQQELSIAYRTQPWHPARIDRLADELACTERAIAALRTHDESVRLPDRSRLTTAEQ